MKILKLLMLLLVLSSLSCRSQNQQKNNHRRMFDLEIYNEGVQAYINKHSKQPKRDYEYKFTKNDTVIILGRQNDGNFYERIKKEGGVRERRNMYSSDGKILLFKGENFGGINIGNHIKYSEDGKILEEVDWDKNLKDQYGNKLTIIDFIPKMKNLFNIDIERDDEFFQASLRPINGILVWEIACKPHPERGINFYYSYLFNAKTGEFISKEVFVFEG